MSQRPRQGDGIGAVVGDARAAIKRANHVAVPSCAGNGSGHVERVCRPTDVGWRVIVSIPRSRCRTVGEQRDGDVSPGRNGYNQSCGIVVDCNCAAGLVIVKRENRANRERQCAGELICLPPRARYNPIEHRSDGKRRRRARRSDVAIPTIKRIRRHVCVGIAQHNAIGPRGRRDARAARCYGKGAAKRNGACGGSGRREAGAACAE